MAETLSPLDTVLRAGRYANTAAKIGVTLSEVSPGSIVQVAAWPDTEAKVLEGIAKTTKLKLGGEPGAGAVSGNVAAFGIAPGRFLVISEDEGLADRLLGAIPATVGSVTDLSHGRTAIRIEGEKAEWLLAKFFAVDFSKAKFPVGRGVSTNHHDVFAQIRRRTENCFEVYVFRSFARSFWKALCHGAEENGYEVR